jgi:hypothetical protein
VVCPPNSDWLLSVIEAFLGRPLATGALLADLERGRAAAATAQ